MSWRRRSLSRLRSVLTARILARRKEPSRRGCAAAFFAALTLCACGGGGDKDKFAYVERPVEQLYNMAAERMEKKALV